MLEQLSVLLRLNKSHNADLCIWQMCFLHYSDRKHFQEDVMSIFVP